MKKLVLIVLLLSAMAALGQVYVDPSYSDSGAVANVSGTYTDQSSGSYAIVKNVSSGVIHARLSWQSPALTDAQLVSVQDPSGQVSSLANYYAWQTYGGNTIVILSYPLQPGTTVFMVNRAMPPSPTPTPSLTPTGTITLQPGTQTVSPGTYALQTLGLYTITVASAFPTPTPSPTPIPGNITPVVSLPSGYVLAFDEEFNEGAAFVTQWVTKNDSPGLSAGGKTPPRWFTQKPVQGGVESFFNSYGNGGTDAPPNNFTADGKTAGFPSGPASAGPIGDGYLYILGWHSDYRTSPADTTGDIGGLLSSLDYNGNGFAAAQAYWEAKIWLPPITTGSPPNAQGLWPAWWLLPSDLVPTDPKTEVDIMEAYSVDYTKYHTNLHRYSQSNQSPGATIQAPVDLSLGWHIYSCLITTQYVTFYLDGAQVSQFASVPSDLVRMFCMVNFAFGGGWPDQQNWGTDPGNNQPYSNTTNLKVAYIRCWALPGNF